MHPAKLPPSSEGPIHAFTNGLVLWRAGNVSEEMIGEAAVQLPALDDIDAYVQLGVIRLFLDRRSLPPLLRDSLGGDAFIWTAGVLHCMLLHESSDHSACRTPNSQSACLIVRP